MSLRSRAVRIFEFAEGQAKGLQPMSSAHLQLCLFHIPWLTAVCYDMFTFILHSIHGESSWKLPY